MIGKDTLLKFKNGDTQAFKALYNAYWSKVYGFTKLYIDKQQDREDVVQDVFYQLWRKRRLIDAEKELDGLLFIITKNMILNRLRRKAPLSLDELNIDIPDEYLSLGVDSSIDAPYLQKYVEKLIGTMPQKQREAFILRRLKHLSIKEIAVIMGISESGVKRNINLALKFLKTNLPLFILFTIL